MNLAEFQQNINSLPLGKDNFHNFCRKYILHGTPFVFKNREEEYYEFRKKIADNFKISWSEIFICGSAKLGFSPIKNTEFSFESDIDVAIISQNLYEKIMWDICLYETERRQRPTLITSKEYEKYKRFLEYSALGWIRPDLLPTSFRIYVIKDEWFNFFKSISYDKSEVGNYKVCAGVFKNYQYFENYTISGFKKILPSQI